MNTFPKSLITTPVVGLENLQRAAFYAFFEGMNNALDEIENYWKPFDSQFDALTKRKTSPTTLERIPNDNFHEGHKPSLIQGDPNNYPNLAVFATRADASPESDSLDQIDSWFDSLLIEVMAKALDEDTCNRRIQRTAEAAVMCVRRNPTLGGAVIGGPVTVPNIIISDLFAVRSPSQGGAYPGQASVGQRYVWQGAQINFRLRKDSVLPSNGPGTFAGASATDYSKFIDQG